MSPPIASLLVTGGWRFLAASYESALERLGAPASARRMAEPNQALVLGIGGRSGRGGSRGFPVRNAIELRTWDLRQHKTTTDDWMAAFRRAVELRTRGLKHKVFIGLSSGYDSGAIMLAMLQRRAPFLALAIRGREVRCRPGPCA